MGLNIEVESLEYKKKKARKLITAGYDLAWLALLWKHSIV